MTADELARTDAKSEFCFVLNYFLFCSISFCFSDEILESDEISLFKDNYNTFSKIYYWIRIGQDSFVGTFHLVLTQ